MGTSSSMKMVNGRVDERSVAKAARVLKDRGLTVSAYIRNSIEYVARTGVVPDSGLPTLDNPGSLESLKATVKKLESLPMPGKREYAGLDENELVERLRMERYGY